MTFATLYIDEGNLLDFHDDRDTARASVLSVVEDHPEVAEDFGMVELDEHGHRMGDFVSGAKLKAQAQGLPVPTDLTFEHYVPAGAAVAA